MGVAEGHKHRHGDAQGGERTAVHQHQVLHLLDLLHPQADAPQQGHLGQVPAHAPGELRQYPHHADPRQAGEGLGLGVAADHPGRLVIA